MKIRKGTEVRVRRTNQIATIEEVELIRKGGKVHKYCHLKTPTGPDLWMDSEELADIHDVCEVIFRNKSNGQVLQLAFNLNHKTDKVKLAVSSEHPDSLYEQQGFHAELAKLLITDFINASKSMQ